MISQFGLSARTAAIIDLRFDSASTSACSAVFPPLSESAASFIENSMSTASGRSATTFACTFASPVAEFLPESPAFTTVASPGQRLSSSPRRPSTHSWLTAVSEVP